MKKEEKKNYIRLLKIIGKDFLKLSLSKRLFMVKTAGIIRLPWLGRFYTKKDFESYPMPSNMKSVKRKLKEKIRKILCSRCGKPMLRLASYQYYCPCNPSLGLFVVGK